MWLGDLPQSKTFHIKEGVQENSGTEFTTICILCVVCVSLLKKEKKKKSKAVVVHSMNKTNLADFCLTGFSRPRAHLSKGLSRLTFLQPNHFPLVSFQSHLFLLSLLLSSLIPSPFLILSKNHFYPTVSFHSFALGLNCPPLLCHSTAVLKLSCNSQWERAKRTYTHTHRHYDFGLSS